MPDRNTDPGHGDTPGGLPPAWLVALVAAAVLLGAVASGLAQQPATHTGASAPAGNKASAIRSDSPRAAVSDFLNAVRDIRDGDDDGWDRATARMDFSDVDYDATSTQARERVRDLIGVLDRIRLINVKNLPDRMQPADDDYLLFPRPLNPADEKITSRVNLDNMAITLERGRDGRWRFSDQTVAGLASMYRVMEPLELAVASEELEVVAEPFVRQYVPPALKAQELLNLEYWQWLGIGVVILLGLMVDHVVRWLTRPLLLRLVTRLGIELEEQIQARPSMPFGLVAAGVTWLLLLGLLGLPDDAEMVLRVAARLFAILAGTWAAWRLIDFSSEALLKKAETTDTKFDDVLVPLLRKTLKIFIVAFGLIYAAQSLYINVLPLITGLGIGGLAFAFAAKDTIENFFGSVAVVLDRPFEVGDWVKIDETEGIVEELGFRSTRIRTFYNSQITVPNATLVRATVDNYGRRKYRRWSTKLGVQYDTTPDQLLAFTEGIREVIRQHPYTRKDYFQVYCNDFADSSFNIMLYVFFEVEDWSMELRERERLFIDIVRLADQLGVSFAFPTRTVHLFQEQHPEGEHQPRHEAPQTLTDKRAMVQGLRAAKSLVKDQSWQGNPPGPVVFEGGPSSMDQEFDEAGNPIVPDTQIEDRTAGG